MDISRCISQLLHQHKYVIIPGFGGFIAKPQSSHITPTQHVFIPPTKRIAFNKRLTDDDGLLINFIAQRKNLSYTEAKQQVSTFVNDIENILDKNQVVTLSKVGKLYYDKQGNLQFSPQRTMNYALTSYGLPEFQFYPVQRDSPATSTENLTDQTKQSQKEQTKTPSVASASSSSTSWKKTVVIALFLLLLLGGGAGVIITYDLFETNGIDSWHKLTSSFSPADDTASPVDSTNRSLHQEDSSSSYRDSLHAQQSTQDSMDITAKGNSPDSSSSQGNAPQATTRVNSDDKGGTYIIMGSFRYRDNAKQMQQQLKDKGLQHSVILESSQGFYRVGTPVTDKQNIRQQLTVSRQHYHPQAWILQQRS